MVVLVYLAALAQGLAMVSFPASGAFLKDLHGLSEAQYGAIFLPQVALAILGAVSAGPLAGRWGLRRVLVVSLVANGISQGLLATSALLPPDTGYLTVLSGTAAMGLGFGLSGAPLNAYPPLFFPGREHRAVVALHTVLGAGLALGPLAMGPLLSAGLWSIFPSGLLALCAVLALLAGTASLPDGLGGDEEEAGPRGAPVRYPTFWLFAGAAVLYAFAEGTFANWAMIYLAESKGLSNAVAGAALSVFWAALVGGRLLVSVLVIYLPAVAVWLTLPVLMAAAFWALPWADTPAWGLGLFALAGLACSAHFPLTVTLASQAFPRQVAAVSSLMVGALMAGVGLGSFLIGGLRELLPLESLYRLSVVYPIAALGLGIAAVACGACRQPVKRLWLSTRAE